MEPLEVVVEHPGGVEKGLLAYTSELAFQGCQGFVLPATLSLEGRTRLVQVKEFWTRSVDDSGRDFSQDPEEEVTRSYEALKDLTRLGFKTVPFFARTRVGDAPVLLLHDLREGERIEVYDEKHVNRKRIVVNVIDGVETQSDAREMVEGLANRDGVLLELMRTMLRGHAHGVSLGYGVAHMITRDPRTNAGDAWVTDVGEYSRQRSVFRSAAPESLFSFEGPSDAALLCQATVDLSLLEGPKGADPDAEWARKQFVKNRFSDALMRTKLRLEGWREAYRTLAGTDPLAQQMSMLLTLDDRLCYVEELRERMGRAEPMREYSPSPHKELRLLDAPRERRRSTTRVRVYGTPVGLRPTSDTYVLTIKLPWKQAYLAHVSGGTDIPELHPEHVVGLGVSKYRRGKIVVTPMEFDPKKLRLHETSWCRDLTYGETVVHTKYKK